MNYRLLTAQTIRTAALDVLDRAGIDRITPVRTKKGMRRVRTKWASVDGLKISYRKLDCGGDVLEIWDGAKVFNVQCEPVDRLSIVSFRRGLWERKLYTPVSELIKNAFVEAGTRSSAITEAIELSAAFKPSA
ncbi:hypothetical protein [Bradyrhizobium canariense]|uniref:Uncharacterized protein n=1 Tax=Bradyrhizobium canariense TaxID=255045 RepID=A0A1X3GVE1_9BRAD|nr:hypothetical protein [Bradyrhizobium canariense]OSI70857.1 hypothetical protein BSZ22_13140 [Bradyrhizobium canariense]OSI79698.1 hypothetical protein BSZ23_13660 [Bradyrhizobium canariense]OSI92315.1 hypothetical protein BSZ25_12645 [Bradyrhizobium canariense]OSI94037.1 hypothetical protein BSZ24_11400 [Bradyrhizobium canariense]OSJ01790.1 hypothetical protein BSZ18_38985 [Bradyrhizobium canariense]